jgi:hypothetical protein
VVPTLHFIGVYVVLSLEDLNREVDAYIATV